MATEEPTKTCETCGKSFVPTHPKDINRHCSWACRFSKTLEQRFWERVEKRGPDDCWPWTGTYDGKRYGVIKVQRPKKRMRHAHRVSYELAHGPIGPGLFVCHRCDNPPCVNPSHLFVGTSAENTRDRDQKGRTHHPEGERHPMVKLTEAIVREIRASTALQCHLAVRYGVSKNTICSIRNHKTWRHI